MSSIRFRSGEYGGRKMIGWLTCGSVRGSVRLVGMNVTLAHISFPFYLNRWKSTTHGFHSKRTQRNDVVELTVALYVDWFVLFHSKRTQRTYLIDLAVALYVAWCVLLAWMSRLLTFPFHSIRTDGNDLTGNLNPIFCVVSFLWSIFVLIAILKLCAAGALHVLNADKGSYRAVN